MFTMLVMIAVTYSYQWLGVKFSEVKIGTSFIPGNADFNSQLDNLKNVNLMNTLTMHYGSNPSWHW